MFLKSMCLRRSLARHFGAVSATALLCLTATRLSAQNYLPHDKPLAMAQRTIELPEGFVTGGRDIPLKDDEILTTRPAILPRTVWNAAPTSGPLRPHKLTRVTIHHEASPRPADKDRQTTKVLNNLQVFSQTKRPWCDVPYHFFVDVDGKIYEGRDATLAGDTNTAYNPAGHFLICSLGNFEIQAPTKAQLDSIVLLSAWASEKYGMDPALISSHRDHAQTACPGRFLFAYVASGFIEGEVRETLRKASRNPSRVRPAR
jgi:hypothetical protein